MATSVGCRCIVPSGLDFTDSGRTPDGRVGREPSWVSDVGPRHPERVTTRDAIPLTCTGLCYQDRRGDWWCVTEQKNPTDQRSRCLVFMSDCAARRVCSFPADWQTLDALQLEALSWRR
jgi:hypothetical protein